MSRAATYACITPGLGPGFAEPEMAKPETAKPEMAKPEEPEEDDAWQFAAPFPLMRFPDYPGGLANELGICSPIFIAVSKPIATTDHGNIFTSY